MKPCPHCGMRGVYAEDRWSSCFYCGQVVRDDPSMAERMESNAKKDTTEEREHFSKRLLPLEAPADVKARVIAAIRAEATAHAR